MWTPSLSTERNEATKHKLITDGIISDIDRGILGPNTRLPTHRELARRLGVSVQTVSIGYREAERRGYLRSEVGRGTFVRDRVTERASQFMLDRSAEDVADLSIVRAAYLPTHEGAVHALMTELAGADNSPWMRPTQASRRA